MPLLFDAILRLRHTRHGCCRYATPFYYATPFTTIFIFAEFAAAAMMPGVCTHIRRKMRTGDLPCALLRVERHAAYAY